MDDRARGRAGREDGLEAGVMTMEMEMEMERMELLGEAVGRLTELKTMGLRREDWETVDGCLFRLETLLSAWRSE